MERYPAFTQVSHDWASVIAPLNKIRRCLDWERSHFESLKCRLTSKPLVLLVILFSSSYVSFTYRLRSLIRPVHI